MHFSSAQYLFSGAMRNHFWSSKCHRKSDTPTQPTTQTLLAPRLSSVYKLGSLPIPKHCPSLASAWFSVAGVGDLDVSIRESHACKWECKRDWSKEEEEREEWKANYCLGRQQMAMAFKTLIWSSGHQVWATLTCILTVFLRHIIFRNVFCALLSKNDRQQYNMSLFSILISEVLWEI